MEDITGISFGRTLKVFAYEISRLISESPWVFLVVPAIGILVALFILGRSIYGKRKLSLDNNVFILFCVAVLIALFISLISQFAGSFQHNKILIAIAYLIFTSAPSIFCLHIWTQVSYKKISISTLILYFVVPALVSGIFIYGLIYNYHDTDITQFFVVKHLDFMWATYLVYLICIIIKGYRLCLNVFYQMPRHMQDSTKLLITALSVTVVCIGIIVFARTSGCLLLYLAVLVFIMIQSYRAFFRASAANVIATSRQFVYSNLGTQIIILSRKGRILEWNDPKDDFLIRIVQPKYLQSYEEYRNKLIEFGSGTVSKHDSNAISLMIDGRERAIQIHREPMQHAGKSFGELIEITEITNIYDVLHQMEEISHIDQLTGLLNRNAYINYARDIMKSENMPLLIMIGDVNNLKVVNDLRGHLLGDRLLHDIAEVLKKCVPERAFLARIGGDEYAILMPNANDEIAESMAKRIEEECALIYDNEYGYVSMSLGWAIATSTTDDYNEVFAEADSWMYKRKKLYKEQTHASKQLRGMLPGSDPNRLV